MSTNVSMGMNAGQPDGALPREGKRCGRKDAIRNKPNDFKP